MQVFKDDLLVFRLLEEAGRAEFNPSVPAVFSFSHEEYFFLFLFVPSGKEKGCLLYRIEQSLLNGEVESALLPQLLALPEDPLLLPLKNEALSIAETIIASRNSNRLFYDAH